MEDAEALALKADASAVRCIDGDAEEAFRNQIEEARARRDTVGGTFEVRVTGLVPGVEVEMRGTRDGHWRIRAHQDDLELDQGVAAAVWVESR